MAAELIQTTAGGYLNNVKVINPQQNDTLLFRTTEDASGASNFWYNTPSSSLTVTTQGTGPYVGGKGSIEEPLLFEWPFTAPGDILGWDGTQVGVVSGGNTNDVLTRDTSAFGFTWQPRAEDHGDGITISTNSPFAVIPSGLPSYHGDGTSISTNTPFAVIPSGLPSYHGDGTTISTNSPFSVITPSGHYCYTTPQSYGSAPAVTNAIPNSAWTQLTIQGGTSSGHQFANDGSVSSNTWTCPVTGTYTLSAGCGFQTNVGSNFNWSFGFAQGGNAPYNSYLGYHQEYVSSEPTSSPQNFASISTTALISAGTTIQLQCWQNSGASLHAYALFFQACKLPIN